MNREIKFRVWDKKSKKIREIDNISFHNYKSCFDTSNSKTPKVINVWGRSMIEQKDIVLYREEKDVILMQFTGLKDKNGVEIYEGDILGFEIIKNFKEEYVHRFVVTWDDKNAGWIQFSPKNKVLVLGNIYENPELF